MKMEKEDEAILKLIQKENIHGQQELIEKLKAKGVSIPQSTLSRRLKRLGVAKVHETYRLIESGSSINQIPVLSIKMSAPNLLVLRTLPGHAMTLAFQLDQKIPTSLQIKEGYEALLGTVAGDDTVLVVTDGLKGSLEKIKTKIEKDFV